jgi:Big-like domain-containing protein
MATAGTVSPVFNFDDMAVSSSGTTLPRSSSGWDYTPQTQYQTGDDYGSRTNTNSWYTYRPYYNTPNMGWEWYGFTEIDNQVSMNGNSLKITVTGGKSSVYPHGAGLNVCNKSGFLANDGPGYSYPSNTIVGDPYIYFWANPDDYNPATAKFSQASGANRFSLYVKAPATVKVDDNYHARPVDTWNFGSFLSGQTAHYYSYIGIGGGGWAKIQLDEHPTYYNGTSSYVQNRIANYWQNVTHFYFAEMSGDLYDGHSPVPYNIWIDSMQFEYDDYTPQNNETINDLAVIYNDSVDKTWEITFNDKYQDQITYTKAKSSYELRYSFSPITNENWASATPANIQAYNGKWTMEARTDGRFKRIDNSAYTKVWASFKLSSADQTAFESNPHIYFAVKDVSQAPNDLHNLNPELTGTLSGQGRDYTWASNIFTDYATDANNLPYIKRIDYELPDIPVVSAFTIPPTSSSLLVPVSSFTATDTFGVTGYLITESSTPPSAGAAAWSTSAPTTYTATSTGSHTLYPWARDAAGNVSPVIGNPPTVVVDTTEPTVRITSPANDSAVTGTVVVTADVTDDVGVSRVEFYENGNLRALANSAPFSFDWYTRATVNGTYALTAKAYDTSGNAGQSATITVTVANSLSPPNVSEIPILEVSDSRKLSGTVGLVAAASDTAGLNVVEFYLNGLLFESVSLSPYSIQLNFTDLPSGPSTITAKIYSN